MSLLPTQFQSTHHFNCTSTFPPPMSHNLYINLASSFTWNVLLRLDLTDFFSKETKSLLCLCPACVHSTSGLVDPQESDTEMLTDEQHQETKRKSRGGKNKRSPCSRLCLWVAGIAITTYGLQAVDSLSSDVRLVGQHSLK